MSYEHKYLKYKNKYLDLKKSLKVKKGGANNTESISITNIKSDEVKISNVKQSNVSQSDAKQSNVKPVTNEVIELENWQITKAKSFFIDMGSLSKIALKKKMKLFGSCFELKFGPFETSKTIGKFIKKELQIKNIDENSITIKDNRNDKIYKLLKSNACDNKIDHEIDLKFRNNIVPKNLKEDYKKFKPASMFEFL